MKKDFNRLKHVFSRAVEEEVSRTGHPILETILALQEEFGVDPDEIKLCITDHLRDRISVEAEKLNLMKTKSANIREFFQHGPD